MSYYPAALLSHLPDDDAPSPSVTLPPIPKATLTDVWWRWWLVRSTGGPQSAEPRVLLGLFSKQNRWRVWVWKDKWCVMKDNMFEYYDTKDEYIKGSPPFNSVIVTHAYVKIGFIDLGNSVLNLILPDRSYIFRGPTHQVETWAAHITQFTQLHTVIRYKYQSQLAKPLSLTLLRTSTGTMEEEGENHSYVPHPKYSTPRSSFVSQVPPDERFDEHFERDEVITSADSPQFAPRRHSFS
eukprot:c4932_g1_i1.p1 GENE.c4932_g1_i1~~c4932_g1_i1.p1  ORF type:complete len:239 (-),score=39.64 c4932_g1_i1:151-867(-)